MKILDDILQADMTYFAEGTKKTLSSIEGLLTQTPEQFSPTINNVVRTISVNAVLPIGYLILGMCAMLELWEMANKHNGGHEILPQQLGMLLMKVAVGKIFLEKTFVILGAILEMVNIIIVKANSAVHGLLDASVTTPVFAENIESMGFLDKFITYINFGPASMILKLMNVVIFILVYGRMIELYLYTAVAPIPISMLINNGLSSTGKNFLKNYAAVALQGVFIILVVGIYGVIGSAPIVAFDSIFQSILFSGVLIFCLFRTSTWAKNVIGG